jgi:hypothetical protein
MARAPTGGDGTATPRRQRVTATPPRRGTADAPTRGATTATPPRGARTFVQIRGCDTRRAAGADEPECGTGEASRPALMAHAALPFGRPAFRPLARGGGVEGGARSARSARPTSAPTGTRQHVPSGPAEGGRGREGGGECEQAEAPARSEATPRQRRSAASRSPPDRAGYGSKPCLACA